MVWKHDCFNCCISLAKLSSVHGIANQISFISTLFHRNRDFRTDVERSVADELFQFKYGRFVKDIGDKWRWAHLFYNFVFQFLTFLCVFCASVQQVFEKTWKRKVLSRFCFLQGESVCANRKKKQPDWLARNSDVTTTTQSPFAFVRAKKKVK